MRKHLLARTVHEAKLLAHRAGFDVTRETFKRHFVRALTEHGVEAALDIGANVGQFGTELRRAGFPGRIVSVEPLATAYERLAATAGRDTGWETERAGVGAEPGTLTLHRAANSVSSSVLPILERHVQAAPQSAYVASETVPATTVDELVEGHGLAPERTLLKIDVQGYEMPVLRGAARTLDRFACVRTEMSLVPLYEGQALLPDVLTELDAHGFELWDLERGFVDPGSGRLLQADGVFFRKSGSDGA
jgi:FkbM family methyltransferase